MKLAAFVKASTFQFRFFFTLCALMLFSCKSKCPEPGACASLVPTTEDLSLMSPFHEGDTLTYLFDNKDTLIFKVGKQFMKTENDYFDQVDDCWKSRYVEFGSVITPFNGINTTYSFFFSVSTHGYRSGYSINSPAGIQSACQLSQNKDTGSVFGMYDPSYRLTESFTDSLFYGHSFIDDFLVSGKKYNHVMEVYYPSCSGCIHFYYSKEYGILKFQGQGPALELLQ